MNRKIIKIAALVIELALIATLVVFNLQIESVSIEDVAQAKTVNDSTTRDSSSNGFASLVGSILAKPTPSPAPTQTPEPEREKRDFYIIAAIGDSMIDTMGLGLDYLADELQKKYPDKKMVFYNYGIGAESLEDALDRFDKPYENLGRTQESLADLKPDVLIVGSYSYNPPFPYDSQKQTDSLTSLLGKGKTVSDNVYLLVEIAPLQYGFGNGPGGVNWEAGKANEHSVNIAGLLNSAIETGSSSGVKVVNVYKESVVSGTQFGQKIYVSPHDNIHPSVEGQVLTAKILAEQIELP
jgi:hypothetical protein